MVNDPIELSMSQNTKNKNLISQHKSQKYETTETAKDSAKHFHPPVSSKLPKDLDIKSERAVESLPAQYTDLLKSKSEPFNFEKQVLPIGAILVFSLALVFLLNLGKNSNTQQVRGISGQLNDLSNGAYSQQSADYEQERTCVDHPDGTKSCTTRTKLKRSFR